MKKMILLIGSCLFFSNYACAADTWNYTSSCTISPDYSSNDFTCCNPSVAQCETGDLDFTTTSGEVSLAGNSTGNFNLNCYGAEAPGGGQYAAAVNKFAWGKNSGGTIDCILAAGSSLGNSQVQVSCHNSAPEGDGGKVWIEAVYCGQTGNND